MFYIVLGAALGSISAASRIPKIRWVPLTGSLLLLVALIFKFPSMELISVSEGLFLLAGLLVAAELYAGALWNKSVLGAELSFWELVGKDITRSGYLRALYAQRTQEADTATEPTVLST